MSLPRLSPRLAPTHGRPSEPGRYDTLAAHVLREALEDARSGSPSALAWLTDASRPFGGAFWASELGAGAQVADALDAW